MAILRPARFALFATLLILAVLELFCVSIESLDLSDAWFFLLLVGLGATGLALRPDNHVVYVLCLLMASLSVLFSGVVPEEFFVLGDWLGPLASWFWTILSLVFPFAFVHFSLIFPVTNEWIDRKPGRLGLIYLPYGLLLVFEPLITGLADEIVLLTMVGGFVLGLLIFANQYFFSLTAAERNRLQLILLGCLAGCSPYLLFILGEPYLPFSLGKLTYFLLPLFPLALAFSVLKENFSEIGRFPQQFLIYSLMIASVLTVFLLSQIGLKLLRDEGPHSAPGPLIVSLAVSLALGYPIQRWLGSFISERFYAGAPGERKIGTLFSEFQPIQPNPYIVGNPVRSPDMFFGREEDFQFILTKLQNQRAGCVVVLYGERRTGKTSILYQILNGRLGSRFAPLFVDMQGLVVQTDAEFLEYLRSRLAASLRETGCSSDGAPSAPVTGYLQFTEFVDSVIRAARGHHFVLLIDEYELIEDKVKAGKIRQEIYEYLNSLLERHPHLSFVFTGSRELESHSPWMPLLGKSFYRKISFLHRKDAEALICRPLQGKAVFRSAAVAELLRLTFGHPFFTQLLCQTLVEVLNERRTGVVDRRIVKEAVQRVLLNPPPQLLYQWSTYSDTEKIVLCSLSSLLKMSEAYVPCEQVDRFLRSLPEAYRQLSDPVQVRMHLEGLRRRSVLDRDQNRYRFTMDLLRQWIESEHSIWSVLKETAPSFR